MIKMLYDLINGLFSLFYILILLRCLLSFFPNLDWYKQPIKFVKEVTDPYLDLFRRLIPPIGMLDISPVVAIIVLGVIQNVIFIILSFIIR